MSVRKPFSDSLTGWGTLAWSRVADDFPPRDVLRSWDQPISVNAGLAWKGSHASLSALAGWHTGWPRTPFDLEPLQLHGRELARVERLLHARSARQLDLGVRERRSVGRRGSDQRHQSPQRVLRDARDGRVTRRSARKWITGCPRSSISASHTAGAAPADRDGSHLRHDV